MCSPERKPSSGNSDLLTRRLAKEGHSCPIIFSFLLCFNPEETRGSLLNWERGLHISGKIEMRYSTLHCYNEIVEATNFIKKKGYSQLWSSSPRLGGGPFVWVL